ncbi:MAG: ABC transporter permease [Chloroflexi bacterium]|nr:ABC transporter permease [Chloroflexota bacterium]
MRGYVVGRLIQLPIILLVVSATVFFSLRLSPGDPIDVATENVRDPAEIERIRREWGLDRPLIVQYVQYIGGVLRGDFGRTFFGNKPVSDVLRERFPATLELALLGLLIGCGLGVMLGVASAVWRNSAMDLGFRAIALLGVSLPSFWLGLTFIDLFALRLGWLPVQGRFDPRAPLEPITGLYLLDGLLHGDPSLSIKALTYLALPATVLGLFVAGFVARITRASVLDALRQQYIVTARAKGIPPTAVVVRHGLRNALLPIVTLAGLQFGNLLGGAAITETVFAWPGLGRALAEAIYVKDFPQVQGSILLLATTYVIVNTLVDLSYGFIDPRIRKG